MTNFELTFTGELFKLAWKNNDFGYKVSVKPPPRKELAMVLSKIQVSDPGPY